MKQDIDKIREELSMYLDSLVREENPYFFFVKITDLSNFFLRTKPIAFILGKLLDEQIKTVGDFRLAETRATKKMENVLKRLKFLAKKEKIILSPDVQDILEEVRKFQNGEVIFSSTSYLDVMGQAFNALLQCFTTQEKAQSVKDYYEKSSPPEEFRNLKIELPIKTKLPTEYKDFMYARSYFNKEKEYSLWACFEKISMVTNVITDYNQPIKRAFMQSMEFQLLKDEFNRIKTNKPQKNYALFDSKQILLYAERLSIYIFSQLTDSLDYRNSDEQKTLDKLEEYTSKPDIGESPIQLNAEGNVFINNSCIGTLKTSTKNYKFLYLLVQKYPNIVTFQEIRDYILGKNKNSEKDLDSYAYQCKTNLLNVKGMKELNKYIQTNLLENQKGYQVRPVPLEE